LSAADVGTLVECDDAASSSATSSPMLAIGGGDFDDGDDDTDIIVVANARLIICPVIRTRTHAGSKAVGKNVDAAVSIDHTICEVSQERKVLTGSEELPDGRVPQDPLDILDAVEMLGVGGQLVNWVNTDLRVSVDCRVLLVLAARQGWIPWDIVAGSAPRVSLD